MDILINTLEKLTKDLDGIRTRVNIDYSGSNLTSGQTTNLDAPIVQREVISFVISCEADSIRGPYGLYSLVNKVREVVLGKRVVEFDPLITGWVETASQYSGEISPGKFRQDIIITCTRPRNIRQQPC